MSDLATALQVKATTGNGETAEHKLEASRLLFLAEFLEARMVPKRIEHWIEPEEPPIFFAASHTSKDERTIWIADAQRDT